jgi:tRNA-dihydrouridine synthase
MIVASDLVATARRLGDGDAAIDFFYDGGRCLRDRPLIVQLAADDPDTFVAAAKLLIKRGGLDGLDLNLGCPQMAAVREHYGACLMKEPGLCCSIVAAAVAADLGVPISVKVRVFGERFGDVDIPRTVEFCRGLEHAG